MPTYRGGVTTVAAVNGNPYCTINTGATRRGFLREVHVFSQSAIASSFALGIPANVPVATTTLVPMLQDAQDATCGMTIGTAWSTPPTLPTTFFDRKTLGASIGQGVIIVFTPFLYIPKSTWLVLWNHGAAAGSALDVTWVVDE